MMMISIPEVSSKISKGALVALVRPKLFVVVSVRPAPAAENVISELVPAPEVIEMVGLELNDPWEVRFTEPEKSRSGFPFTSTASTVTAGDITSFTNVLEGS